MRKLLFILGTALWSLAAVAATYDDGSLRRYQQLYMESVCQREAGNEVAQYRLLQQALRVNPNGAEAYFDLAMMQKETRLMMI